MDFSKNSLRMRLHNIRPFIVPITEFIDIPVVAETGDLPAGCFSSFFHCASKLVNPITLKKGKDEENLH